MIIAVQWNFAFFQLKSIMILIVVYFPKAHFCHYQVFWTLRRASVGPQQRWIELDWTGLYWIRTIANFVEFGLDPECKALQNLGSGQDLDWVDGKEMGHFCCEKTAFFQFSGFSWTWKIFGLWLDSDWVLKNQDWIWIAKYDRPLIFGPQIVARQHQKSIFAFIYCRAALSLRGMGGESSQHGTVPRHGVWESLLQSIQANRKEFES